MMLVVVVVVVVVAVVDVTVKPATEQLRLLARDLRRWARGEECARQCDSNTSDG